jgi:hypothetical protein
MSEAMKADVSWAPDVEIESEKDWQEYLEKKMTQSGWYVKREVTPTEDNVRADLIAKHDNLGDEWLGIETKRLTPSMSYATAFDAVNQIVERYRYKHWPCKEIRLWGVAPYISESFEDSVDGEKSRAAERAICDMVNYLGIGYLQHHASFASLYFGNTNTAETWRTGIPLFALDQDAFDGYTTFNEDLKETAHLSAAKQLDNPVGNWRVEWLKVRKEMKQEENDG